MAESIDTTKLDPATLAKHLGNPEGDIGRAVTAGLNKTNAGAYTHACARLEMKAGEQILEIGFGNGREIPRLLSLASDVTYTGLDISPTMIDEAKTHNSELVQRGRVKLVCGTSANIPAETGKFDKALALNTIYFWEKPDNDLRELRRVVKRGGRLVLGANAPWSATGPVFQHGFRHYEAAAIEGLLQQAGFTRVSIDTINEDIVRATGQQWNRDFFIVSAE